MDSKNKVKKIWDVTQKILLIFLVICLIILSIRIFVFKKTDIFGYRIYLIMSGSMQPEINVKDAIITADEDNIQVGDIIAFQTEKSVTAHRVVSIKDEDGKKLYQTKGDNNNIEDTNLVEQSQIKGKVVRINRTIGRVLFFLKQKIFYVALVIVILILIVLVRRLR